VFKFVVLEKSTGCNLSEWCYDIY